MEKDLREIGVSGGGAFKYLNPGYGRPEDSVYFKDGATNCNEETECEIADAMFTNKDKSLPLMREDTQPWLWIGFSRVMTSEWSEEKEKRYAVLRFRFYVSIRRGKIQSSYFFARYKDLITIELNFKISEYYYSNRYKEPKI